MRFLLALLWALPALALSPTLEIREGDRVLLLGDVLLEREGNYGAIETRMTQEFRDRRFTVRNLSWSGESPLGVARASFDAPGKGWERLQEQIANVKPTVAVLGLGMAASLQELTDRSPDLTLNRDPVRYGREPMTAQRFQSELEQLLAFLEQAGVDRLVLLSPLPHQDLRSARPGLPDPAAHTALLAGYAKAIEMAAEKHHGQYVSLAGLTAPTNNGIHLTPEGYTALADHLAKALGWAHPAPPSPALQAAIVRKNQLFFYQFRPENYTYLFGFRKHEQGQNAAEIPAFEPLIARAEGEIEHLKIDAVASQKGLAPAAEPVAPAKPPETVAAPTFDVQEGFQIELWATNPLLEKPIQMNWDATGRLWIASSSTYPQVNPEDVSATLAGQLAQAKDAPSAGNDRILVLEDSDHDGKPDRSTVFAEGLLIPTAVAPFRNALGQWACYVGQSTEILELTDTDGDGKADQRRVVLSGFGTEDTHHLVHTMKFAPGGELNFNQSIYIHSHLETPWGMVRLNSGGVLSWDPRTEKVGVFCKGFINPWGHVWDRAGNQFITDGAGSSGISWAFQGAMFPSYENARKILPSVSPGSYPKFCSLEIIYSPHFPKDWQGSLITCDFRAHRVVHFGLNDLSATKENATSGFITKELPDLVRTSDLSFRPIDVRLGPDGALYIADWSNPVINHGEVDFRDARRDHHQGRIWRVTQRGGSVAPLEVGGPAKVTAAAQLSITSANPRERLLAMRQIAGLPTLESAGLVLEAALKAPPNDAYYDYAAWLSMNDLAEPWSSGVLSGAWPIDSPTRERQLEFALSAIDPALGGAVLSQVLRGRTLPADGAGPWIELIGRAGGTGELRRLFDAVTTRQLEPAAAARALAALTEAQRVRALRPEGDLTPLEQLLQSDVKLAAAAAPLLGAWKTPHALALLQAAASSTSGDPAVQLAAIRGLQFLGGPEAVRTLQALVLKSPSPSMVRPAAVALAALDLRNSFPQIAPILTALSTESERLEMWRALLSSKGAAGQVVAALAKGKAGFKLEPAVASIGLRAARELGKPGDALATALAAQAGINLALTSSPADYMELASRAKRDGDPVKGEEIYRRVNLACTVCHSIGGVGGKVGPELTSLGASAPLDYIIESVLVPTAKVKEGFNAVNLTLKDGGSAAGIQSRETAQEVFLRNVTGQEMAVAKEAIVSRENIGSIMPAGLTEALEDRERLNLYAFLSQLGRPGNYDASKGSVARLWALQQTPSGSSQAWPPPDALQAPTLVDGRLMREQLQSALAALPAGTAPAMALARFQLPTAGAATFHFTGATAAQIDGRPLALDAQGAASATLPNGEHTVAVQLDPSHLPEFLRLDSPEARFLGN